MSLPSLLPGPAVIGQPLFHAYLREILGKRTFGRVLNVGAGTASRQYAYAERLNNAEYHTLEISPATGPTYVGDVRSMPQVPSEHYDWVLAIAVLEHVSDMHAAVEEITRVLKPGGYVYLSIPLHNEIHFGDDFNDYWRVTPFGMHELLDARYGIVDVEYWGESLIDPVSISVIARKGAAPSKGTTYFYRVEGGLETIDRFIDGSAPFMWSLPVYRMKLDGIEYIRQVRAWRAQYFTQTGASLTNKDADHVLFAQGSVLEGHLTVTNDGAEYRTAAPAP
ncbi:MAG TPA: class I SAM-dependent methyltransferase [Candidatus Dormibacteraeota bacterium]|nr:class I SAM-dependent methyltransferase [Candidatus Dormibacteraeota bacterium]